MNSSDPHHDIDTNHNLAATQEWKPITLTTIDTALPDAFSFDLDHTALVMIDFQRDFLLPGGFGELLGNNVTYLHSAVIPALKALSLAREIGMTVIHTVESHKSDLSDLHASKKQINEQFAIGDIGPMGRILIRHEYGNDIIPELAPLSSEIVIYKNGKGAFYHTKLLSELRRNNITHLIFTGVTTEVCVFSTMCEARDRGFHGILLKDATASYFPKYKDAILDMVIAQGGIVGHTASTDEFVDAVRRQEILNEKLSQEFRMKLQESPKIQLELKSELELETNVHIKSQQFCTY